MKRGRGAMARSGWQWGTGEGAGGGRTGAEKQVVGPGPDHSA
jgi:hypothetical protein